MFLVLSRTPPCVEQLSPDWNMTTSYSPERWASLTSCCLNLEHLELDVSDYVKFAIFDVSCTLDRSPGPAKGAIFNWGCHEMRNTPEQALSREPRPYSSVVTAEDTSMTSLKLCRQRSHGYQLIGLI